MGRVIETYEQVLSFIGIERNIIDAEYEEIKEEDEDGLHD